MAENKLINYKASPTAQEFHKSNAFVKGIMGPFGCLSVDTQVLTESGWVDIGSLLDEKVAEWDSGTGIISFKTPIEYHKYPCEELTLFSTKSLSMCLSDEHRVPLYKKDGSLLVSQAKDLISSRSKLRIPTKFTVTGRKLMSSEVRFRVAVEADGHNVGNRVTFSLRKERKKKRLRSLLEECGLEFTEKIYGNRPSETVFSVASEFKKSEYSWGWKLGSDCLEEIISELNYWDGNHSVEDDRFFTKSKKAADFIQFAAHATGRKANIREVKYPNPNWANTYTVFISKKDSIKSNSYLSPYVKRERVKTLDGFKYCLTTSTGFFLARHNGSIFITSNSGKSVAMCWEIFMRAKQQTPATDGIRRSRWIIARNTQPQLETTTIKTWLDWFPENLFGRMSRKPPFTHHIKFGDIDLEVIFLALDKPEDIKKLLSFEVTGVFFNEAREIEYDLVAGATGRVGRYPSKKDKPDYVPDNQWPKWHGIIMDTNPPTDDHWWYKMAEEDAWAINEQGNRIDPKSVPPHQRWEFWKQPSGLSKEAENIENLPGGYDYYKQQIGGKNEEWINVYVHGNYGFIKHGLPVYKGAWNPDIHTSKLKVDIPSGGMIYVGVDASGRHPAAVFLARTLTGRYLILHELCITDDEGMGAVSFAKLLKQEMNVHFPNHGFEVWGDPAGNWASQNDERTYFDILRANGIMIKPSPGLRIPERIETVISCLERNVQGHPVILVDPSCKVLLRGFNGGYRYRKLNTSGGGRYDEKPEKNRYSDVQDALQYVLCGIGELKRITRSSNLSGRKTVFADNNFKF